MQIAPHELYADTAKSQIHNGTDPVIILIVIGQLVRK